MIINSDNMQIFDISMMISSDMPVYKGKEAKRPRHVVVSDFTTGSAHESQLDMNLHTGTHLDMPLHMIEGGKTVETLDLTKVITPCKVFDLTSVEDKISLSDIQDKDIKENDFVLFKTKNSFYNILETDFIYVDREASKFLVEKKIKGVGIDSLGIERNQSDHLTHIQLLGAGIVILEGLHLKEIEEGDYMLLAAPLNILGAEGSPMRAVLLR